MIITHGGGFVAVQNEKLYFARQIYIRCSSLKTRYYAQHKTESSGVKTVQYIHLQTFNYLLGT